MYMYPDLQPAPIQPVFLLAGIFCMLYTWACLHVVNSTITALTHAGCYINTCIPISLSGGVWTSDLSLN